MGALLKAVEDGAQPLNAARGSLDALALVFAAIASARRGVPVAPGTRPQPCRRARLTAMSGRSGRACSMRRLESWEDDVEARPFDRAVSRYAADGGRRLGGLGRLRGAGDRLLAEIHRADAPLCRHHAYRRRRTSPPSKARRSSRRWRRRASRSPALGYYPNPLHPDPAHRKTVIDHLKKVIVAAGRMGVPLVNTFCGGDAVEARRRQLAGGAEGLAGDHRACARQRREARLRELPDDLQRPTSGRAGTTSPTRPISGGASSEAWGGESA